jgi:hypothetical protein
MKGGVLTQLDRARKAVLLFIRVSQYTAVSKNGSCMYVCMYVCIYKN